MNEIINGKMSVSFTPAKIECNIEEMRESIKAFTEQYKGYLVQDETEVANAKKVVANLNSIEKSISDQRIAFVKEISKPQAEFETTVKAICADIHSVSTGISEQVKAFETAEKERKRAGILALPDYADYIVFDDRWLNKTYTMEMIQKDLENQKSLFQTNCTIIKTNAEIGGLDSADYLNALANGTSIEEITATMKHDHDLLAKLPNTLPPLSVPQMDSDPTIFTRVWKIKGTNAQLTAIKDFMGKIGVKYEKVELK